MHAYRLPPPIYSIPKVVFETDYEQLVVCGSTCKWMQMKNKDIV